MSSNLSHRYNVSLAEANADLYLSRKAFLGGLAALSLFAMSGCQNMKPTAQPSSTQPTSDANTQAGMGTNVDKNFVQGSTFAFDTIVTLAAYGSQDIIDKAVSECARYDNLFSRTIEGSDIWKINTAGGKPVEVTAETADLLVKSLEFCDVSQGYFDITIGAVSSLWDFERAVKPEDAAIQEGLKHIDYHMVHVNGTTVQLDDPKAMLDLGGIAKGWIADALAQLFKDNGVTSGLINLGGNVMAVGEKPGGKPWRIAIQDPNSPHGEHVAVVDVKDRSVVTSGLYERHFFQDGVDYYHILNPKTGYPVTTDLLSDTIISVRSVDGDGFSTTLFLRGVQKALEIVEARNDIETLFVTTDKEIVLSSNFGSYPYELTGPGA